MLLSSHYHVKAEVIGRKREKYAGSSTYERDGVRVGTYRYSYECAEYYTSEQRALVKFVTVARSNRDRYVVM